MVDSNKVLNKRTSSKFGRSKSKALSYSDHGWLKRVDRGLKRAHNVIENPLHVGI